MQYKVEIVSPTLEIFPNKPPEPHKRLFLLKPIFDEEVILYKIGDNFIKKIIRKNMKEYIVNSRYSLKTPDHLTDNELISLLFVYNN